MPDILKPTYFGNPILRTPARKLRAEEVLSAKIKKLTADILFTLEKKPYGVGMAAPQVGEAVALAVLGIKPSKTRPDIEEYNLVLINPVIIETYGYRTGLWEGCKSCGSAAGGLFAKVPRYKKLKLQWLNEKAELCEEVFDGFKAHVIQHEVDHLNGILFVDKVKDTKTYMTASEYKKRIVKARIKKAKK